MGNKQKLQKLNQDLLHTIVDHWEGRHTFSDYSQFLKEYQGYGEKLLLEQEEEDDQVGSNNNENGGVSAVSDGNSAKSNSQPASLSFGASAPATSQPAASSFSFGGTAAPPAPPPAAASSFSFGESAPAPTPVGTFSFASKTSAPAAAGASSAPSFSFGASSGGAAPSSSASSFASSAPLNNDDPTSNPDDGKVEKIEAEENTEEEILYEVRAKHIKFVDSSWKKYGAGVLRLYKHKATGKHRMVIRNEIGKVQFNVGVSKGMTFEKIIKNTKKGKACFVKFVAVEDVSKGLESFMLQVKPDAVDKLHETLEGMVA